MLSGCIRRRALPILTTQSNIIYQSTKGYNVRADFRFCRPLPTIEIFKKRFSTSKDASPASSIAVDMMSLPKMYRYLSLETFQRDELDSIFNLVSSGKEEINSEDLQQFLLDRITELEKESDDWIEEGDETDSQRNAFAAIEARRLISTLQGGNLALINSVSRETFCQAITNYAEKVDFRRTWPITASMLLVGSSVGVVTPAMPFVVEELSLSASQYGLVVSAFGLAKMIGNVPSAIAVERHGRKPYMTYSLLLVACGVGGIGLANSFEGLYTCRLLTGFGVSFLSAAGTLMVSDLSTPLNRASTFAPIMSAFSAGTALGPALGGVLVDQVGLHPTFYIVGLSYLGVAALNKAILEETQSQAVRFPWQQKNRNVVGSTETISSAVKDAVGQWLPLLKTPKVRNIVAMNGMYWVALAGSQMTLLPLILTNSDGMAMSATQVGQVYMCMSLVQIVGNPVFARVMDRTGKAPAIVAGCSLVSASMAGLVYCEDYTQLACALGLWGMGSSILSTAPLAYLSDNVNDATRAQAIALLRTCGDVGFLVGATCIGRLADWTGSLEIAMQSSAGLLLTATAWFAARQRLQLPGSESSVVK